MGAKAVLDVPRGEDPNGGPPTSPHREPSTTTTTTTTTTATITITTAAAVTATTTELAFVLSPEGAAGQLYRADLKVVGRHSESNPEVTDGALLSYDVCEVIRQVVSPANGPNPGVPRQSRPPLIKDVETTTLYRQTSPDRIEALQRTLTFAVPDPNQDPAMAGYIVKVAQGRAIDVRTYDVVYTRVRPAQPA